MTRDLISDIERAEKFVLDTIALASEAAGRVDQLRRELKEAEEFLASTKANAKAAIQRLQEARGEWIRKRTELGDL